MTPSTAASSLQKNLQECLQHILMALSRHNQANCLRWLSFKLTLTVQPDSSLTKVCIVSAYLMKTYFQSILCHYMILSATFLDKIKVLSINFILMKYNSNYILNERYTDLSSNTILIYVCNEIRMYW